jgi:hypothetical protein
MRAQFRVPEAQVAAEVWSWSALVIVEVEGCLCPSARL